ncbi:MAG: bacteriohemerythrin, partial [Magnetospiraceae bacterium]
MAQLRFTLHVQRKEGKALNLAQEFRDVYFETHNQITFSWITEGVPATRPLHNSAVALHPNGISISGFERDGDSFNYQEWWLIPQAATELGQTEPDLMQSTRTPAAPTLAAAAGPAPAPTPVAPEPTPEPGLDPIPETISVTAPIVETEMAPRDETEEEDLPAVDDLAFENGTPPVDFEFSNPSEPAPSDAETHIEDAVALVEPSVDLAEEIIADEADSDVTPDAPADNDADTQTAFPVDHAPDLDRDVDEIADRDVDAALEDMSTFDLPPQPEAADDAVAASELDVEGAPEAPFGAEIETEIEEAPLSEIEAEAAPETEDAAEAETPDRPAEARAIPEPIEWTESLSTGVEALDAEHRSLIDTVNLLNAKLADPDTPSDQFSEVLEQLAHYGETHFPDEEATMAAAHYPGLETHKQLHRNFVSEVASAQTAFDAGADKAAIADLGVFLNGWVAQHLKREDVTFRPYVMEPEAETEAETAAAAAAAAAAASL